MDQDVRGLLGAVQVVCACGEDVEVTQIVSNLSTVHDWAVRPENQ